jgi:hypothetical protein
MIPILGPLSYTGTVVEPKPPSLRLFLGDFQPFPSPDAFHTFVVYLPAVLPKKSCDTPVSVTTILAGQFDDRLGQDFLIALVR